MGTGAIQDHTRMASWDKNFQMEKYGAIQLELNWNQIVATEGKWGQEAHLAPLWVIQSCTKENVEVILSEFLIL